MPPKVRKRVPSAKSRIEKIPQIARKEMGWFKSKTGELRRAALSRKPHEVEFEEPKPTDRSFIHTHPSFPHPSVACSAGDLWTLKQYLLDTNIRNMHVATIDKRGRVIGYLSVRAKKNLLMPSKIFCLHQNQES